MYVIYVCTYIMYVCFDVCYVCMCQFVMYARVSCYVCVCALCTNFVLCMHLCMSCNVCRCARIVCMYVWIVCISRYVL